MTETERNTTSSTNTYTYQYGADGLRTSKTVNGVKTDFYWLDGRLYQESNPSYTLIYKYDESGSVIGFTYKTGTTSADYYYVHNILGEVMLIIDSTGDIVVEYTYDPWGVRGSQTFKEFQNGFATKCIILRTGRAFRTLLSI